MGNMISLTADDGQKLGAYRARPTGTRRAGLVVIQEIFGVNGHIRSVCDGFAADGYDAIAPALFDRAEQGVELGYDEAGMTRGRAIRGQLEWDNAVRDIAAALATLSGEGKVGVVGYCWGGSLAWLAATRLGPVCAVSYYGGQIVQFKDETAGCPMLMHFGDIDKSIPLDDVATIRAAHPEIPIHVYPGGHGFNCDQRADYQPESATLARERTLAFLAEHLG